MSDVTRDDLAREFHEVYEALAPAYDYSTRVDSAVPWDDVPEPNKSLMLAVSGAIIAKYSASNHADYSAASVKDRADWYADYESSPDVAANAFQRGWEASR